MSFVFSKKKELTISDPHSADHLHKLPSAIIKHTKINYSYKETADGCFLKPMICYSIPYRNSFVPEIAVTVSERDSQTVLSMQARPMRSVRIYMSFWFGFLAMMEAILLALALSSNLDTLLPLFIPVVLCVFAYLLCKITMRKTFESIVKAIDKEFL